MKYLLLVTSALVFGNLQGQTTTKAQKQITLFFNVDESTLDSVERQRLHYFSNEFVNKNIFSIHVEGHTDSRSSRIYNEQLSAKRAQEVKTHLAELGFADSLFLS